MHRGLAQENCEPRSATLKAKKKDKKERKKIELEVSRINPFRVFLSKRVQFCADIRLMFFVLMG